MNKAAKQYKLRVKHSLFCGRTDKKYLLDQLTQMLDDFQQERAEADYTEYVATFGEPAACAAELLSSLREFEFAAIRKRHLWVRRNVYAAVLAVFVLLSAILYYRYERSLAFNENTVVVIGPAVRVTEEEAEAAFARASEEARSYG